jgi:hypothetical protein
MKALKLFYPVLSVTQYKQHTGNHVVVAYSQNNALNLIAGVTFLCYLLRRPYAGSAGIEPATS